MESRILGYGALAFVAAEILAAVAIGFTPQVSDGSLIGNGLWLLVNLSGGLVPLVIGFFAAYHAPRKRIAHGSLAVAVGAMLFPLLALRSPFGLAAAVFFSLLGWLGAIAGSYQRGRKGS